MASGPTIEHLFATPVIVDQIEEAPALNAGLESLILARRAANPGIRRSNVGGWHSDTRLLDWGGEPARRLAAHVVALADAHTADRSAPDRRCHDWRIEAWANVAESGASNSPHVHGGCYWSAVYYVRTDAGEGGDLVFHDPRMPGLVMHAPDLKARIGGEQQVSTRPVAGMLILFPAWLTHSVTPWRGQGRRISLAFNLTAAERPREGLVEASVLDRYQPSPSAAEHGGP